MTTTAEPHNIAPPEPPAALRTAKIAALIVLAGAILGAIAFLSLTEHGRYITHNRSGVGLQFQHWVAVHRAIAPIAFLAIFVTLCVLMLPVWWLQILAGYGFGIVGGLLWCEIGATLGAVTAMHVSRWIAADFFHRRVESRLARLRELDEKLGHNGFLVVIAVRLMHFMPVGVCNYVFGLTTISTIDVIVGTLLGSIPVMLTWVAIGAGLEPWKDWNFIVLMGVLHVILLAPLLLRYLKPRWFKRYGIE
ncbi:hypothetical protein BH09PLA1_BH09PLA1_27810 [soil metagenome]